MRIEGDSIGIRDPGAGVGSADRPGVPDRVQASSPTDSPRSRISQLTPGSNGTSPQLGQVLP